MGVLCLIAAIVRGQVKGMGVEIPLLTSVPRQVALGGVGVVLILIGSQRPPWLILLASVLLVPAVALAVELGPKTAGAGPSAGAGGKGGDLDRGLPGSASKCFTDVSKRRVRSFEEGTDTTPRQRIDAPGSDPFGIAFTDGGRFIGGMILTPIPQTQFAVTKVFDSGCRPIDSYGNPDQPSSRDKIQNYEPDYPLVFEGRRYALQLGYEGGKVELHFHRTP
jgi:hypothetical protein